MTNDGVGPICPNGGISSGQMTALSPANTFVNRLRPPTQSGLRQEQSKSESQENYPRFRDIDKLTHYNIQSEC